MRLFCYGTLQFPAVIQQVSGLHASGFPATLEHHACLTVRGEVYPGIVPQNGAQTPGVVYAGLGLGQLRRLDAFEGDCYERRRVMVCDADGRSLEAWAYLMRPDACGLLGSEPWDRELFRRRYLPAFLRGIGAAHDSA